MRAAYAGLCALIAGAAPVSAQSAAPADSTCEAALVPYTAWASVAEPVWTVELAAPSGGTLTYLGAEHSIDPAHPQFTAIRDAWKRARPTVAFFEGPNRPAVEGGDETIRQLGESGYVRFLAARDSAAVRGLEPSPMDEMRHVSARFPAEQVRLFYVLREAARLRDRRGTTGEALDAAVAELMQRAAGMMPDIWAPAWSLDELADAYARHWTEPADWRQASGAWFDPLGDAARTGGRFTHDINRASSEFRNLHMYRLLSQAVREGERVFAVVGRNHVAMQAAALRCALR